MHVITSIIIEYIQNPHKYKVFTDEKFGFVYENFPKEIPIKSEPFDGIVDNLKNIILPGNKYFFLLCNENFKGF